MLRLKDYGNEQTTTLLRALEVTLGYRFMFLEERSEFSPLMFNMIKLEEFQEHVSEMLDGLNFLLYMAEEYHLSDPNIILDILGTSFVPKIDDRRDEWVQQRTKLYAAATRIASSTQLSRSDKDGFIVILQAFCDKTRSTNVEYLTAVLNTLNKDITNQKAS